MDGRAELKINQVQKMCFPNKFQNMGLRASQFLQNLEKFP